MAPRHKDTLLAARSVDAGLQSLVDAGKLLVVQSEAVKETLACERPDEHRIEYRLSQPGQSSDGLLPASSSRIPAPVSADGVVMALTGLLAWSLLALMLMSWILQW